MEFMPSAAERLRALLWKGLVLLLFAVLVAVAGILRLTHLNWDQFQHVHPDERFIVWVADSMRWSPGMGDWKTALDPAVSPFNPFRWPPTAGDLAGQPRAYAYGHFPLYLMIAVAHVAQTLALWLGHTTLVFPPAFQPLYVVGRHLAEYEYLALVGRAISAICDLGTVVLVYFLARRVIAALSPDSRWLSTMAGLLATGAYAGAVLPIQLSHFCTVDMVLTFWVTATLALASRWAEGQAGWFTWWGSGAAFGLAVASKFNAIMLIGALMVAACYRLPTRDRQHRVALVIGRMIVVVLAGLFTFGLSSPFAFIEPQAYLANIAAQSAMVSGVMDAPYTRQYIGTVPYWYFIQQLSQWGLGWPLGVVIWAGFIWAVIKVVRGQANPPLAVLLAWAMPYFGLTGVFHAKFLRYMAPILPCLVVCGAGLAAESYQGLRTRWGRPGQAVWTVVTTVVLLFTAGWALAFTAIYRQEHPWIRASRWIYQHIPEGSKLLTEHWDDALPLRMDELSDRPALREYQRVELPLYEPDTSEKLDLLTTELSRADYLIIASNRLYRPIARLPKRYPLTSHYYRLLWGGDLGYRLVAEFAVYPTLGRLVIADDHADESFTVYDHPHVFIFANTERMSAARLHSRLGRYLPLGHEQRESSIISASRSPGHARHLIQAPAPGAPLTLKQPVDTLPAVHDFRWNHFASVRAPVAAFLWWLIVSFLGWLVWPLFFPLLSRLRDHGYGLARGLGWLLVGWVHWLGVSLGWWQNRAWVIAALLALLVLVGGLAWYSQRRALAHFWSVQRWLVWSEEVVFALAFLAFVFVRLLNPDLWQPWNGGEKYMEFAFLNAILRSACFPPYDPYFAGGIINYYYYGLYLVSLPIKLTGIVPEVAFNLAIPALFALTALGVFSLGVNLARDVGRPARLTDPDGQLGFESQSTSNLGYQVVVAVSSVLLALIVGNLASGRELWRSLIRLGGGGSAPGSFLTAAATGLFRFLSGQVGLDYDYWSVSRVIPYTINEFPFWSFVFADLHPHLIAMPFGLVVVGLALNWALKSAGGCARQSLGLVGNCLLLALSVGTVAVINPWDLPTYLVLVAGALLLGAWRERRPLKLVAALARAVGIGLLAWATYWPFYAHYQAQLGNHSSIFLGRYLGWAAEGSPLDAWLWVWGLFLFLAYSFVLVELIRPRLASMLAIGSVSPEESKMVMAQPIRLIQRPGGLDAESSPQGPDMMSVGWPPRWRLLELLLWAGIGILLAVAGRFTAALAGVPFGLVLTWAVAREREGEDAFTGWLLALGLAILAGTELIYLRDFLHGSEWYRMNTVFKFSMPAWLFLGLTGGVILPRLWEAAGHAPVWIGMPWRLMAAALLSAGFVFLLFGVPARVADRFPGPRPAIGTLDGTAFMKVGHYTWPDANHTIELSYELQGIRWLLDHVIGTPVVAEAPAGSYEVGGQHVGYDYYRAGGLRVASLTGLPTFVGQHQYEQRPAGQVSERTTLGKTFFHTTDIAQARQLLRDLRVGYIYVGTLEHILFPPEGLRKFDVMVELGDLEVVYRNRRVTIYRAKRL